MAFGNTLYSALFKRTSTFVLTVVVCGVFFERIYDSWADSTWERMNKGKLWKDIKHNYEQTEE